MVDSGADYNVVAERDWEKIKRQYDAEQATIYDVNHKPSLELKSYATPTNLIVICTFSAWIETTARPKPRTFTSFAVIKGGTRSLLGRDTAIAMKLLEVGLQVNAVAREAEVSEDFPAMWRSTSTSITK